MIARALRLGLGSLLLLAALPAWRGPARAGWQPAFAGPAITAGQAITSALSRAPAAPEAEVGPDDFRVSYMGADKLFDASDPAVAYNAARDEYLVVWAGDDNTLPLVDGEREIFALRMAAATGAPIGGAVRVSHMGPDGNVNFGAFNPAVAYNSQANEYLVVWHGDHGTLGENEVYGRRLDALAAPLGSSQVQISDLGPPGDTLYSAGHAAVAYDSTRNEYLVVWHGTDNTAPLVLGETEIFGQRLDASGVPIAPNDVRLSSLGPDGSSLYDAQHPAVAFNSALNQYLVVWSGDDNTGGLVDNELEIFGQRVDAATGAPPPAADDLRLSQMGGTGSSAYAAYFPAVAFNSQQNEYLVVWMGDDNTGGLANDEYEIFVQRVNGATGAEIGSDTRLSSMGPDGDADFGAFSPRVAYHNAANEYLVAWHGDDLTASLVDEEHEVYARRVAGATGAPAAGADAVRLSRMGPDGSTAYAAAYAAVALNPAAGEYLVVWQGAGDTGGLVSGEVEIFAQRVAAATGAEAGPDDIRLSYMGPEGHPAYDGAYPAAAYNAAQNEYLVVWQGDHNAGLTIDDETEVYGQRVDAATGALLGGPLRLSDMGPDGNADYDALNPDVVYNPLQNEYLVVWWGDDNAGGVVNGEYEIFGQRVNAAGAEVGGDFRISEFGPNGNVAYAAREPAVAYNSLASQYLVVWDGNDDAAGGQEIFGQRLQADSSPIGANDFLVSDAGSAAGYLVDQPDVAFNSAANEYLVVWHGDGDAAAVQGETEVFGHRVDGSTGNELGADLRLSDVGPAEDTNYTASYPAVAFNRRANEYLVVWHGNDDADPAAAGETEIYGQRLNAAGAEIGPNDVRLTHMGPDGNWDPGYAAAYPAVAYNDVVDEYLVVWMGADGAPPLALGELEIFGQRLESAAAPLGGPVRLSNMGPVGNAFYRAAFPGVAFNRQAREYLVVWYGDDDTPPLALDDLEIFGQRFAGPFRLFLPSSAK